MISKVPVKGWKIRSISIYSSLRIKTERQRGNENKDKPSAKTGIEPRSMPEKGEALLSGESYSK
jgi:hypothetical protein